MLPHGIRELGILATQCVVTSLGTTNGWDVDEWNMTAEDVDCAVDVYNAVHVASMTPRDPVIAKLAGMGIDVMNLLAAPNQGMDLVTRSDIAEYAAAASVIAADGFTDRTMQMPNIPKMARRKSDSGIDVFDIKLDSAQPGTAATLNSAEQLGLASVKHTTTKNASSLRLNIQKSISQEHELSQSYLMAQLRFVHGRLVSEGMAHDRAQRVFLFMDSFPNPAHIGLYGIAVIDPKLRDDLVYQMRNLPAVAGGSKFRIVTFPDLGNVQHRCP